MASPRIAKSYKLPKHLLEMKFMKKTKEKEEKQKEDEDRQTMFSHEITSGMLKSGLKFVEEPSLVPLLGLKEGRFSYLGMNPEIERIMINEDSLKQEEEEKRLQESKEKSVTDKEMTQYYGTLSNTIAQKFKTKRHWKEENDSKEQTSSHTHRKKYKFMKPEIDDYK